MQDWPALVCKGGVNAVVDKVAVAVGDKDAEDKVLTGAGDSGLELENTARRVLENPLVVLEGLKNEAAMREHHSCCNQVSFLELAWLILHLKIVNYARVRADDLRDLTCSVGVAKGDA